MSVRKRVWTTRKGERKDAWMIDYSDQDGRHMETFERKKDAEARHAEVAVAVRRGTHVAPTKSITVAEAADNWIKHVEADGKERSTLDQYRQHAKLHIVPRLGRYKLATLSPKIVETFRDGLLADLSRPLARKVLTSVKSLLKGAGYSHVAANVAIKVDKRGKHRLEVGRDIPRPEEVNRLIKAAPNTGVRALLLLAALTGLRASELRGLRWYDVDLKKCELHVRQRASRYRTIGAPKSEASKRTIPLEAKVLLPALREWKLACPKGEADLVFPTPDGGVQHHETVLRSLAPVMVAAGVVKGGKPKYTLHAFRHFFASWCINSEENGGRELPPKEAQVLLGHSSIVMTLDRYGHLFPRRDDHAKLSKAVETLLA
jgi:integrase